MMKIIKSLKEITFHELLNCELCKKLKIPYIHAEREAIYGRGPGRVIGWRYCGPDFSGSLEVIQSLLIKQNKDKTEEGENFKLLLAFSLSNEAEEICIETGLHYNIALAIMTPIHKVCALLKTFKSYKTKFNKEYEFKY